MALRLFSELRNDKSVFHFSIFLFIFPLRQIFYRFLDISPRVVAHLQDVVAKGQKGKGHSLFLPIGQRNFLSHLPGVKRKKVNLQDKEAQRIEMPATVLKTFNPIHGDVITDHIAKKESYDLIIIWHTFMYFTEIEKLLALDNLKRLLKPGGILISDVHPDWPQIDWNNRFDNILIIWKKP